MQRTPPPSQSKASECCRWGVELTGIRELSGNLRNSITNLLPHMVVGFRGEAPQEGIANVSLDVGRTADVELLRLIFLGLGLERQSSEKNGRK